MGVTELATELGVHPNTVRFHLDALLEHGQVQRTPDPDPRPGRPRALYQAASGMDPAGPRQYLTLAAVLLADLAGSPDGPTRAANAGRAWGARLDPPLTPELPARASAEDRAVHRLVALMDACGFAPQVRDDTWTVVELWHCPFLELAQQSPEVVCAAHLGIMQGALDAWDAPLAVERLDTFGKPGRCLAHLTSIGGTR